MSQPLQEKIDSLRQHALIAIETLTTAVGLFDLPPAPAMLSTYRQKLAAGTYNVLVVGEAKRGKSSFVNAIIGRPLLPTDEKIATSQAFRISHGATDRFGVRYADGSSVMIGSEDLARYGSQTMASRPGIPTASEVISWIDVQVPARFLPRGVTLIDTPGVGSLYMGHAQITHRFIADADAVIFVVDSERPIIQEELQFLSEILRVTRSIFFVQTKVDLYGRDEWGAILARNQEILRSNFGDVLPEVQIWPCSNEHLMRAASTNDQDYLRASRYEDLAVALQTFLFRNAGWLVAAEAIGIGAAIFDSERATLAGRLAALSDESGQLAAEMEAGLQARKQEFERDWSGNGLRHQDLLANLRALSARQQQQFLAMLRPGGSIDRQIRGHIAAIRSFAEAEAFNRKLPGAIVAEAQLAWRQVRQETEIQCNTLFGPLIEASVALRFPEGIADKLTLEANRRTELTTAVSYNELVRNIYESHGRIIHVVADYMVRAEMIDRADAAAYAEGAARIWAMVYGWYQRNQIERSSAQQQLLAHHEEVLGQVESYFAGGTASLGSRNIVQHYFDDLVRLMDEQAQKVIQEQLLAAQEELNRLAEGMRLELHQRQARAAEARANLEQWDAIGRALRSVFDDLKALV